MSEFYTILTQTGQQKIADAIANSTQIDITEIAFGDGGGASYEPTSASTGLVNEVYRTPVNNIYTDPVNSDRVIVEAAVPTTVGGWYIREAGIFDSAGSMITICKFPPTYKPILSEGSGKDMFVKIVMLVGSASVVNLSVNAEVVLATRQYVDDVMIFHEAKTDPHSQYATDSDLTAHIESNDPHPNYATGADISSHISDAGDPHAAAGYVKQSELTGLLDVEAVPQSLNAITLGSPLTAGTQLDVGFDYIANGLFLEVYRNGARLAIGAGEDYQEVVGTPVEDSRYVTFNYDLAAGEKLLFAVSGLVNLESVYASAAFFDRNKRYFFGQI